MRRNYFLILSLTLLFVLIAIPACKLYYTNEAKALSMESSPELIVEGRHLAMLMCAPCHYDASTKQFTGGRMLDVPGFVGKVYTSNITQHPEKGMGSYSDGEFVYLMRTGISRSGKLMPYMQRPNLADRDLNALLAFFRSDDPLVKSSDRNPGATAYTPVGKFGITRSRPLPMPEKTVDVPVGKISKGKYLIDNLGCYDCHSKSFIGIDKKEPEKSSGYMGGGNPLKDRSGKTVRSSNLTQHATGIGSWTEADFKKAMRDGISKDGTMIAFPMPYYSEMSDEEISAIYDYLKTLPAIDNRVKK